MCTGMCIDMRFDVSNRDDAPSIVWHIIAPLLDPSRILMRDRHVLVHDLHVDPAVREQFFFRWDISVCADGRTRRPAPDLKVQKKTMRLVETFPMLLSDAPAQPSASAIGMHQIFCEKGSAFGRQHDRRQRCVFLISRSMPTANTEDPCRSEAVYRRVSPRPFRCQPSKSIQPSASAVDMTRKVVKNRSGARPPTRS